MAIERFEVGKKYRWVGPQKPYEWGIPEDMSKIWEKGGGHKLYKKTEMGALRFVGIISKRFKTQTWFYGCHAENFEEVIE